MKHIFFIDNIEKLNVKKDSSLMMMLTFKSLGHSVYALTQDEFFISNDQKPHFYLWEVKGEFKPNSFYLDNFEFTQLVHLPVEQGDVIHMRIDPPYDSRYQRYLWMLDFLSSQGANVVNSPRGIMQYNEKITALKMSKSVKSYVGSSERGLKNFLSRIDSQSGYVLKPLDLFSGIGVVKTSADSKDVLFQFREMTQEYGGAIIVQPFLEDVYKGELRSIYYKGSELGTIVKFPPDGSFVSNIAQGATFEEAKLDSTQRSQCEELAWELKECGVDLVAFDLLGESITEVNITCPGLIVEVSEALGENLAIAIAKSF